ncbi:MAG: hypothetical protein JWQ12_1982 [Glaciihabitans sp.]|nr:hypothetical protein [Glaciihabitans sp.]
MSTFRNPVGPQPSGVYWRRRLIVGLGALAVIVVIILLITARPGSGKPTGAPSGSPTSAAPSTRPTTAVKACDPAKVSVEAITDSTSYAKGALPKLSLSITNTGTVACTLPAGSDKQEYLITSGAESIWSSKDCQKNPVPATATLLPGTPVGAGPIEWDRTRSSTTTCTKTRPQVTAGGASYHLTVVVDGISSPKTVQFVLK